MKFTLPVKFLSLSVLLLGGLIGCANQTQKAAEPTAAAPAAPSAAVTQALNDAGASVKTAKSLDWIWRDTEKLLQEAEEAAAAGDEAKALKSAKAAKAQADEAVNQYYLEKAKTTLIQIEGQRKVSSAQKTAIEQAVTNAEGKKAFELASKL
jgi:hypothetical protein